MFYDTICNTLYVFMHSLSERRSFERHSTLDLRVPTDHIHGSASCTRILNLCLPFF